MNRLQTVRMSLLIVAEKNITCLQTNAQPPRVASAQRSRSSASADSALCRAGPLFLGRADEDGLHVSAHVQLFQTLVAFVEDKVRDLVRIEVLLAQESQHSAGSANENGGDALGVAEHFDVLLDRNASVYHFALDVLQVLAEALELVLDLKGKLASVSDAQTQDASRRSAFP